MQTFLRENYKVKAEEFLAGAGYLSMAPADVQPVLDAVLQPDGTPRRKMFALHAQPVSHVTDLRHTFTREKHTQEPAGQQR